jgi:hypothetical protein
VAQMALWVHDNNQLVIFSLQPRHQIGPIEGDFAVALSLYHGYDLLLQHGLLPFYNFIKGQYINWYLRRIFLQDNVSQVYPGLSQKRLQTRVLYMPGILLYLD